MYSGRPQAVARPNRLIQSVQWDSNNSNYKQCICIHASSLDSASNTNVKSILPGYKDKDYDNRFQNAQRRNSSSATLMSSSSSDNQKNAVIDRIHTHSTTAIRNFESTRLKYDSTINRRSTCPLPSLQHTPAAHDEVQNLTPMQTLLRTFWVWEHIYWVPLRTMRQLSNIWLLCFPISTLSRTHELLIQEHNRRHKTRFARFHTNPKRWHSATQIWTVRAVLDDTVQWKNSIDQGVSLV